MPLINVNEELVLFAKYTLRLYNYNSEVNEDDMSGVCSTNGGEEECM
jgi:hypothetical protein